MKSIKEFSAILDGDPSIGNYVHRILLVGTRQLEDDRWMYAFPSLIKVPLPALRVLDIRLVRLVRCSKEDVRAYSDWILALPAISSSSQVQTYLSDVQITCDHPSHSSRSVRMKRTEVQLIKGERG